MILYTIFALVMLTFLAQAVFNLYMTVFAWDDPELLREGRAPKTFEDPYYGFTVFLPVREEEEVIGGTLAKLGKVNYPKDKLELMVLCTEDDPKTIAAARKSIKENKITNARVLIFEGKPGKSRGMNAGLAAAKHPLITIFDAEDDVSEDLFSIANTIYLRNPVDVLQCGVQLMDYDSRWFSIHNVLEYFFWFKSRMHFQAHAKLVPLGGNSVFFRASDLKYVGGWDEHGLTEDADIGIRLSVLGKKFRVCYDKAHVTREETPHTVKAFIKQRTRWNQGFLQILKKDDWKELPLAQRLMGFYVLSTLTFMGFMYVVTPFLLVIGLSKQMPAGLSLLSFLPLIMAVIYIVVSLIGLYEFGQEQKLKIKLRSYVVLVLSFYPYQILLFIAAVRSVIRELFGSTGWEKTAHSGNHRQPAATETN